VRAYEVVYIFDSQLTDERVNEKVERYHAQLTGTGSAEVSAVDHWGRRQLAFPIRKRTNGYYVVAQFRAPTDALPEFERLLKLDEELLRYLVVLHEGEPSAPMSIATRQPKRAGDDEDEDEGDDEEGN
jgi:small subunit ribosomal protein S6